MTSYFWTYGITGRNKPIVVGPFGDETKATDVADKLQESQVFNLVTRNQQQATRQIKAKLAEFYGDYTKPVRNFGHGTVDGPQQDLVREITEDDPAHSDLIKL